MFKVKTHVVYVFFLYICVLFKGRPEEQDDSENSTIYITGLTDKVNLEEMAEFFKHVGPIRVRKASVAKHTSKLSVMEVIVFCICLDEPQTWTACH